MQTTKKHILKWLTDKSENVRSETNALTVFANQEKKESEVSKNVYKFFYKSFLIDWSFNAIKFFHFERDTKNAFFTIDQTFFKDYITLTGFTIYRFISCEINDLGNVFGVLSINSKLFWFKTNDFLNYANDNPNAEKFLIQFLEITSYFNQMASFNNLINIFSNTGVYDNINDFKSCFPVNCQTFEDEILIVIMTGAWFNLNANNRIKKEQIRYLHFKTKPSSFSNSDIELLKNDFLNYTNQTAELYGSTSHLTFYNVKLELKNNANNLFTYSFSKNIGYKGSITNDLNTFVQVDKEKDIRFNYRFQQINLPQPSFNIFYRIGVDPIGGDKYRENIDYTLLNYIPNVFKNTPFRGKLLNDLDTIPNMTIRLRTVYVILPQLDTNPIDFDVEIPLVYDNYEISEKTVSDFVQMRLVSRIENGVLRYSLQIYNSAMLASGDPPIYEFFFRNNEKFIFNVVAELKQKPNNPVSIKQWQTDLAANFNYVISTNENYVSKLIFANEQKNALSFENGNSALYKNNANLFFNGNKCFLENNLLYHDYNNDDNVNNLKLFRKTVNFSPLEAPPTSLIGTLSGFDYNFNQLSYLTTTETLNTNLIPYQRFDPSIRNFERIFIKNNNVLASFNTFEIGLNSFAINGLLLDLSKKNVNYEEIIFTSEDFYKESSTNFEQMHFLSSNNFFKLLFLDKIEKNILNYNFFFKEGAYNANSFLVNNNTTLNSLALDKASLLQKGSQYNQYYAFNFLDTIKKSNILFIISSIYDDVVLEQEKTKKIVFKSSTNYPVLTFDNIFLKKLKNEIKYINTQINFRIVEENELIKSNLNNLYDYENFMNVFNQTKNNSDFLKGKISGIYLNNDLTINELNNFSIILNELDLDKPFLEFSISKGFSFNKITIKNNDNKTLFEKTFIDTNFIKFKVRVDILT